MKFKSNFLLLLCKNLFNEIENADKSIRKDVVD